MSELTIKLSQMTDENDTLQAQNQNLQKFLEEVEQNNKAMLRFMDNRNNS